MGAVYFSIDSGLAAFFARELDIKIFIESGTFRGDSIALVRDYFTSFFSIELSEEYYRYSKERFENDDSVSILKGDSGHILADLAEKTGENPVLFWLDAHWCEAENTEGKTSQCPLLRELRSINSLNENSVILIDDARLYLCPPGKPHEYSQWPDINEIWAALKSLSNNHELMIMNDIVVFYPKAAKKFLQHFCHENGVDWLEMMSKGNEYSKIITEIQSKDAEIQIKDSEIQSKDAEIQIKDSEIQSKDAEIQIKDSEIQNLLNTAKERLDIIEKQNNNISEIKTRFESEIKFLKSTADERLHIINQFQMSINQIKTQYEDHINDLQVHINEKNSHIETLYSTNASQLKIIEQQAESIREFQRKQILRRCKQWLIRHRDILKAWTAQRIEWLNFWRMPRLGVLQQYPPRPMHIPKWYYKDYKSIKLPKISIVTPSFNQADFIERTVKSVLEQNYPDLEYVVQDGGSKDNTTEILKKYKDIYQWESARDKGQANAINLGFRKTSGDIMAYLNSDDMLLPGALYYIAEYFSRHPEVDAVYGHRILVDEYDGEIGRWVLPPHNADVLTWADYIPQETLFWRRRIWEKTGGMIDESFQFAMDWDMLLRFQEAGAKFVRLPRFLGVFRVHSQQKTSDKIEDLGWKEMQRLRKRCHNREISDIEIYPKIRSYLYKHVLLNKLYRAGLIRY